MAAKDIILSPKSMERSVAKVPKISIKNRYIERNGVLNDSEYSFISRPAMKKWIEVGPGHIRKMFSEPGVFDSDVFVVSGTFLYRVKNDGTSTLLGELNSNPIGSVSMAATAPIGDGPSQVPPFLFIAEGGVLWLYTENGGSRGTLQASASIGAISNGDVVEINGTYYQFTSGSVDSGTPAGTLANPWLVNYASGVTSGALTNLYTAINGVGVAGTDYSTALTAHTTVDATAQSGLDLFVAAKALGTVGDAYTTTETSSGLSWGAGTLQNGGTEYLRQIIMPEDYGAISVDHINSYVIVIPIQNEDLGTNGRFYWIEPGETVVDPLNFATAERSPDKLHQVVVFGEMFWLLGEKTTEPWITTGAAAPDSPVERFQGILFDRGSWEGTAIQVKDSLIVCDEDGGVFQIQGGQTRISTPEIEEKIRRAIQIERN